MHAPSTARVSRWLVLLVALAMVAAACGGAGDTPDDTATPDTDDEATEPTDTDTDVDDGDAPETVEGGTIVWGYDQEPQILNPTLSDGNMYATSQIALSTLYPLWIITPEFEYVPSPLLESAEVNDEGEQFSVTYNLTEDSTWSDGTPITAGDVLFTLETCLNEEWTITSRAGCDEVDMEATEEAMDPDSKTIEVIFNEVYAPWQTMFSTGDGIILPRHVLEGEDWNTVWNDELTVASGPFMFDSWDKGQQLTLVRNDNFFGEQANLERIVFRFLPDSNTQVQQLRGGEIDMFDPQPQIDLVQQVQAIDGVELQTDAGPVWEHIDFQHTRPPLDQQYVRQALSMAIDREAIIEQIIAPVNPDAEPLNSIVYVNNQAEYEDHFGDLVAFDPEGAIAMLEENGCTRGDDQIFECEGERMEFDFTTIAGNERRELTFEIVQAQFSDIGVQLNSALGEAAVVFADDVLAAGNYDMFEFAWVGSPDPAANVELFRCDGMQNYTGHCNPEADELLLETRREVDPDERARIMNEAGQLLANDIPILPLYQLPVVLAFNTNVLTGPQVNTTQWGQVWNIGEWQAVSN
jgi:peptide/nickel transport system substrate-binding protein